MRWVGTGPIHSLPAVKHNTTSWPVISDPRIPPKSFLIPDLTQLWTPVEFRFECIIIYTASFYGRLMNGVINLINIIIYFSLNLVRRYNLYISLRLSYIHGWVCVDISLSLVEQTSNVVFIAIGK